jgi:hypothetical protein
MIRRLVIALVVGLPAAAAAQHAKRCVVHLISAERQGHGAPALPGDTTNMNYDVAGNVHLGCVGQPVFMNADSVSDISGDFFRFFTHADYRDPDYRVTADTLVYIRRLEKIEARGNVRVLDRNAGSTLTAPYVDYFRPVKGINDSASVLALMRGTVHYFKPAVAGDTARPLAYVLVGDILHGFGQSRLRANGNVTIDHDSVHGLGDSLWFDRGATDVGRLMGQHATLTRTGSDSFAVFGHEIRVAMADSHLRDLRAFDSARVVRAGSRVTGDTIQLGFASDKLALTLAWSRLTGATLRDAGYNFQADSLAIDTPDELLREIRGFVHAVMISPRDTSSSAVRPAVATADSVAPDTMHNTLWGDRVVAHFVQADSAGHPVTRISHLEATGEARSLFSRMVMRQGKLSPSINYTRADTILVLMHPGDTLTVASVQAYGHVDGVQLETATKRKPGSDTTAAVRPATKP